MVEFQNSKSHSGAEFQNSNFKIQNLTLRSGGISKFKILSAPELNFKFQNSKSHSPESGGTFEISKFKIQNPLSSGAEFQNSKFQNPLSSGVVELLKFQNSKFKILSAPELNFKIQIQNLTPPELKFKSSSSGVEIKNSKSHSPESEISKFKNLTLRRVKFQNSKFKISLSGVEFQNPPAPESEISKFKILQLRRVKFQNSKSFSSGE